MNKLALQLFLVLAFIPIAILISSIIITLAPLYCWGLAINAYRFGNTKVKLKRLSEKRHEGQFRFCRQVSASAINSVGPLSEATLTEV